MPATVEVVLLHDVDKIGSEGSVVRVAPGFARNFLLPRQLAVPATPERMRAIEALKQQRQRKAQRLVADAESLKRTIEAKPLTLTLSLGMDDKPFGAITSHDVLEALVKEHPQVLLEKHAVQLEESIKSLGMFEVPVRIHPNVTATVKLWVVKA